ncbi:hypothetical protein BOW50_11710 [Solemya velum gill symbiont]|uniref:hypothetical protein n=1 Tax=Solemya velum gill symbiont TaxID=2340 RepID=UPI000998A8BB|nr:hypothetical protein [Solemya velum gill symbiont]OOZ75427.1 hypothetical protein BOW50_11710 [Solemya velum gill symbiont]
MTEYKPIFLNSNINLLAQTEQLITATLKHLKAKETSSEYDERIDNIAQYFNGLVDSLKGINSPDTLLHYAVLDNWDSVTALHLLTGLDPEYSPWAPPHAGKGYKDFIMHDDSSASISRAFNGKYNLTLLDGLSLYEPYQVALELEQYISSDASHKMRLSLALLLANTSGVLQERYSMIKRIWDSGDAKDKNRPSHYVKWALSRNYEVPWLEYAQQHAPNLLPDSLQQTPLWEFEPDSPYYPDELDIAMQAWRAVSIHGHDIKNPKEDIKKWIREQRYELTSAALERIATVCNWNKAGGKPASE